MACALSVDIVLCSGRVKWRMRSLVNHVRPLHIEIVLDGESSFMSFQSGLRSREFACSPLDALSHVRPSCVACHISPPQSSSQAYPLKVLARDSLSLLQHIVLACSFSPPARSQRSKLCPVAYTIYNHMSRSMKSLLTSRTRRPFEQQLRAARRLLSERAGALISSLIMPASISVRDA